MNSSLPALQSLLSALVFAANKHRDQRRKGANASPYINHPIAVAELLARDAGIADPAILMAAVLHDTIEDTDTTIDELRATFGGAVADMVLEVTDDKTLPKHERKALQIAHAAALSHGAKLVKLADKICNVRDMADQPPDTWPLARRRDYFDWAKAVVDRLRGTNTALEAAFDEAFARRPLD